MPFFQAVTLAGTSHRLEWDASTDLLVPNLADGSYYLRVTAVDAKGNTQQAFDRVSVGGKTWFGVLGVLGVLGVRVAGAGVVVF